MSDQPPTDPTEELRWPDRHRSVVRRSVVELQVQRAAVLLYVDIFEDEPGQALTALLDAIVAANHGERAPLYAYGRWFRAILAAGGSPERWLIDRVLRSDNAFSRAAAAGPLSAVPETIVAAAVADLRTLQLLYKACTGPTVRDWILATLPQPISLVVPPSTIPDGDSLRSRLATADDWGGLLPELADRYRQEGTGAIATFQAFRWRHGQLEGIPYPDGIQLDDLAGYDRQKQELVTNTERLLAGRRALNILLYGARGTGKSSLVKALLSAFGDRGLRLVEVGKAHLRHLPEIVEMLRDLPQKFIVFVDDLSFEEDDDDFKALKVVLEGSLTARPTNVAVYATTNRRHLVREFFDDRPRPSDADEIHHWDTVQEKLSFSDRFGLTVTFEAADQDSYLTIVRHLARRANLAIAPEELRARALRWATRHNGRSGRTARQFVDTITP